MSHSIAQVSSLLTFFSASCDSGFVIQFGKSRSVVWVKGRGALGAAAEVGTEAERGRGRCPLTRFSRSVWISASADAEQMDTRAS